MSNKDQNKESFVEQLRKALDETFGLDECFVKFENGRATVDLEGFLKSEKGHKAFEEERKAAQAVPWAPHIKRLKR